MSLSVGIVGLPNAGKSTLFNALIKRQAALAENYPFCTIEPNKGIVNVPDERLGTLAQIVHTQKQVPATVEFVDIAGLVKGAHKGEGLGNQFLAHIRETDAIAYMLRFFEDENVVHVADSVEPERDLAILQEELILADLSTVEKQTAPRPHDPKNMHERFAAIQKVRESLNRGMAAGEINLTDEEGEYIKELCLLTAKPAIYIANCSEAQLSKQEIIRASFTHTPLICLSAKLESELIDMSDDERTELLHSIGINEPALNILAQTAYQTLSLISFLTAGEKEVRAWTITKGARAPQAAGVIHSDFEKKFIKADVVNYADFVEAGGWLAARQKGIVRSEGKAYTMQEGDVVEFKIGS